MNKKLIISLAMVGVVAAIAIGATTAYFSNTETSSGNTFVAGAIDLKVDNECHYNGRECVSNGDDTYVWEGTYEPCYCTWKKTDLKGELFFNFLDVKPGDSGEDTISLHVDTNPAWICAEISNITNAENGCNPPEAKVDNPETSCDDPGEGQGELQDNLYFSVWMDPDCDNVYDGGEETYIIQNAKVTDVKWPIADSQHGGTPIKDTCIGVAWNVPSAIGNEIQGDSITGDVTFKAYQARNNDGFLCYSGDGCFDQADVMLVLDRSGSISGGEMTSLKSAANAFVTVMNPDGGVHMGQTSFSTNGSLDQVLTGDQIALHNAINALSSGGTTNLYEGILLADGELAGVNDRPDGTTPDYMIVITDGRPNEPGGESNARTLATGAATAAKTAGVTIYVVGVGSDVDATYLRDNIASSLAHYYGIGDYDGLEAILTSIANCEAPPPYCGDGIVNNVEECEADADCTGGEVCKGCMCEPECTPQLTTLFSDGFESGNFSAWTSADNDWYITTQEHAGSYAAYTTDQGSNDDILRKAVSAANRNNIGLSYWYQISESLGTDDHVYVEWFDGSNWNQVAHYTNLSSGSWTQASFSLPIGANNNASFQIRFRAHDLEDSDELRLDDVLVNGYTICP